MRKLIFLFVMMFSFSGFCQPWNIDLNIASTSEIADLGMVQNQIANCEWHGATIINMKDANGSHWMKLLYFDHNTGAVLLEKDFPDFVGKQIIGVMDFIIIGFSTENQLQILKIQQVTGNVLWRTGINTGHNYQDDAVIVETRESTANYIFSCGLKTGAPCAKIGKINDNGNLVWINDYCYNTSKTACVWEPISIINRHNCGEFDGIILAHRGFGPCGTYLLHVQYDGSPILVQKISFPGMEDASLTNVLLNTTQHGYIGIANSSNNPNLHVFTFDNSLNIKGASLSATNLSLIGKSVFYQWHPNDKFDILISAEGTINNRPAFVTLNYALNTILAERSYQPDLSTPTWSSKLLSMNPLTNQYCEPYYIRGYTNGLGNNQGLIKLYMISVDCLGNAPCSDEFNVEISCNLPELTILPLERIILNPPPYVLPDNSNANYEALATNWCEGGEFPIYPRKSNISTGDDFTAIYQNNIAFIKVASDSLSIGNYSFDMCDVRGRTVKANLHNNPSNSTFEVDYSDLSPGVYLLKAFLDGKLVKTFKVVRSGR